MEHSNITQRIDGDEIKEQSTIRQPGSNNISNTRATEGPKEERAQRARRCSIKCSENFGKIINNAGAAQWHWFSERTSARTCSARSRRRSPSSQLTALRQSKRKQKQNEWQTVATRTPNVG